MTIMKIKDFNPDYKRDIFGGEEIKGYDVYADINNEKVGTVYDILVDDTGRLRYVVIDTGWWVFGKKVLLPVGCCRIDYSKHNLYALGLTKEQTENLPDYDEDTVVDYDYEERVRSGYRGVDSTAPTAPVTAPKYDRNTYDYQSDAKLYQAPQEDNAVIKLYEERLVTDKSRQKSGDVTVGKVVTTETARVSVPVEKEQVIIERRTPTNAGQAVSPGETAFQEGEVARMALYEETATIHKETFVTEEVSVKKTVEKDTVTAEEQLRREELSVDVDGKPMVK
ncbi:MAG: hypothetical protein N5P05_001767 [Chroococcopsis gigantea SAG 12.99]|jgi:uncharacterized protein (TIGR02271 family)|nr:hypothetical protein [Chroococcopsis gigantea SAG 12.99]